MKISFTEEYCSVEYTLFLWSYGLLYLTHGGYELRRLFSQRKKAAKCSFNDLWNGIIDAPQRFAAGSFRENIPQGNSCSIFLQPREMADGAPAPCAAKQERRGVPVSPEMGGLTTSTVDADDMRR